MLLFYIVYHNLYSSSLYQPRRFSLFFCSNDISNWISIHKKDIFPLFQICVILFLWLKGFSCLVQIRSRIFKIIRNCLIIELSWVRKKKEIEWIHIYTPVEYWNHRNWFLPFFLLCEIDASLHVVYAYLIWQYSALLVLLSESSTS
jgi:hypothetical protein